MRVIRLIGRNTVEEIILKRAEDKLKLTEKVIEEGEFSLGLNKQSLFTDKHVPVSNYMYWRMHIIIELYIIYIYIHVIEGIYMNLYLPVIARGR